MPGERTINWTVDRRLVLRFLLGLGLIVALVYWAGPSLGMIRRADPVAILAAIALSLLAFGAWFEGFYRSIRSVAPTTRREMLVPFLGGSFTRMVTPAGTLSGVAVGAYLAARWSEASGDRTLGALAVLEVLMITSSALAAGVGLAATVAVRGSVDGLGEAIVAVVGMLTVLVVALVVVILRPGWIVRAALMAAGIARRAISWIRPGAGRRFSREVIQPHIDRVLTAAKGVAADRPTAAIALLAAFLGWVAMGLSLYAAAAGLDVPLDPWVAVALVPIAGLAGFVPTPGGLGAIDGLLVGLLLAVVGGDPGLIVAVTLLFRFATFWVHLAISGVGALLGPERRPRPEASPSSTE